MQCRVLLAGALTLSLLVPMARATPQPIGPRAVGHRDLAPRNPPLFAVRPPPKEALYAEGESGPIVTREVLGYLPYWEMDYQFQRWDLLTVMAWFGASLDSAGNPNVLHGWGGAETEALIAEAQAHGVVAILTVTNFDNDSIAALLGSPTARANAIDSCLSLMAVHGADGVNIDFEFVPSSVKSEFVTFMADLKDAVAAAQPNGWEGHVSLAGPAIDWGGAYDYDQLLIHTDGIMIMAYGYHWSGGNPGPISPLHGGGIWGSHCIEWTVNDYLTYGGEENRHRILVGLPFYGREWPVANTDVPGTALGSGESITFIKAEPEALAQGKQWDDTTKTPYYHIQRSGQLWQVWYDDGASLEEKVAYVDAMDLGGIGIWALGYDGAVPDYWDAIEAVLVPPPVGPEPGPEAVEAPAVEPSPPVEPDAGSDAGSEPDVGPGDDLVGGVEELAGDLGGDALEPSRPTVTGSRSVHVDYWYTEPDDDGCTGGPTRGLWWLVLLPLLAVAARKR